MTISEAFEEILKNCNGSVVEASRRLDMSRCNWYALKKELPNGNRDICLSLAYRITSLAGCENIQNIFLPYKFAHITRKGHTNETSKKAQSNNDSTKGVANNG